MKRPPLFIRCGFSRENGKLVNLWFPCFLLWPLVLVLIAVPVALLLLVDILTGFRLRLMKMVWAAYMIVVASRGTVVDVTNKAQRPIVAFKII